MSIFNIKLKTKNGNDVKKRETFTVFFSLKYKRGLSNITEYTYRILYSGGVVDSKTVLSLKKAEEVMSIEDMTLKVILNLCHILYRIFTTENINPDFINFISLDLDKGNKSLMYLRDVFSRKSEHPVSPGEYINPFDQNFEKVWEEERCKKIKIKKEELDLLKSFSEVHPNTVIMTINPTRDSQKYYKSIQICNQLKDRIDRNLQMTG